MYREIENILVRTLSSYEYEKIEKLKEKYNEEQIIQAYKSSPVKNINYIEKYITKNKIAPHWLDKEIKNEDVDNETIEIFNDFNEFINDFRKD